MEIYPSQGFFLQGHDIKLISHFQKQDYQLIYLQT